MGKMLEDYDHLLNIDHDRDYKIPFTVADSMIATAGRETESLNGTWNFSVDVYDTFIRKKFFEENRLDEQGRERPVDFDFDRWETVEVPSNWNVQKPEYWFFEGTAVYTRKFDYNPHQMDERVFLRVGAANYESRVWLNGSLLARHQGGFTPYFVEVSDKLVQGENRLIITVNNERKLDQIPSINYDWFNYGGISRDVELIRVPKSFIRSFRIHLVPDGQYRNIAFSVGIEGAVCGAMVRLEIPELNVAFDAAVGEDGKAEGTIQAQPVLWSPENPQLYTVRVSCGEDQLEDSVGFRQVHVEGKQIYLNGKPLFLKGVCCHEESIPNGRAMTLEEREHMIRTAKEMGCNIMRLSHYPHSEATVKLADRLGMMLWEEIPVYWALCFEREETFQDAENQLREMVMRDYNRASTIIWGIGNENPDTDERLRFMCRLKDSCVALDKTRLTAAACLVNIDEMKIVDRLCEHIDVVAINEYYGWYYRDYEKLEEIFRNSPMSKPLVISETGADSVQGMFGDDETLFTEDHQAKMYRKQFEISEGHVQGIFPWILFDFRSPVRLNPLQGSYNRKGLIGADKQYKKMAYHVVKEYYSTK